MSLQTMSLQYIDGHLHFAGRRLSELIREEGTPLYVYDLQGILKSWDAFCSHVPNPSKVHYAMKANSNFEILKGLSRKINHHQCAGVDVVSLGELDLAVRAGFDPKDILFSGVSKTKQEIQRALELGICLINVESPQELLRIAEIASSLKVCADVSFRMNPDVNPNTHPYITTGFRENKFGMDFEFLPDLIDIMERNKNTLRLCGLSMHIGSQMLSFEALDESLRRLVPLYLNLQKRYPEMKYFNVGGGVGIPYTKGEQSASLEDYQRILKENLSSISCTIFCEPGRFIVGPYGVLLGEIQYIKESPHKNFILLDTGMNHLIRPALYGAQHKIWPLEERHNIERWTGSFTPTVGGVKVYDVVGPICESSDVLGRSLPFCEIQAGDCLAILDVGAYGFSMASTYNSRPLPPEIVI